MQAQFGINAPRFSDYPLIGVLRSQGPKGLISDVYTHLLHKSVISTTLAAQAKWQTLILDLLEEDWEEACSSLLTVSPAINNKLIQLYMLHQSYLSPVRLHAMHRIPAPGCTRCTHQRADFNHMWLCPVIAGYWKRVLAVLSQILSVPVPCTLQICLLGILDEEQWPKFTRILLRETLFLARKAIVIKWNQSAPPST